MTLRTKLMAFLSTNESELNVLVGASQDVVHPVATSDEALIAQIAKGDRYALKLLYGRHHADAGQRPRRGPATRMNRRSRQ